MQVREGTETSYALVSAGGRVVSTFDAKGGTRARDEAGRRRLRLFKLTLSMEEMPL